MANEANTARNARDRASVNTLPRHQGGIWVFTWTEIINALMQFISVIAALIFGVWAVKSFNAAQHANALAQNGLQQSLIANQLALLSLCISDQAINATACADVLAAISLPSVVTALQLVPSPSTSQPSGTATSLPVVASPTHLSLGSTLAIVIAFVSFCFISISLVLGWRRTRG